MLVVASSIACENKALSGARQMVADKKCEDAEPLLKEVLTEEPDNPEVNYLLGRCQWSSDQQAALARLRAAVREGWDLNADPQFSERVLEEADLIWERVEVAPPPGSTFLTAWGVETDGSTLTLASEPTGVLIVRIPADGSPATRLASIEAPENSLLRSELRGPRGFLWIQRLVEPGSRWEILSFTYDSGSVTQAGTFMEAPRQTTDPFSWDGTRLLAQDSGGVWETTTLLEVDIKTGERVSELALDLPGALHNPTAVGERVYFVHVVPPEDPDAPKRVARQVRLVEWVPKTSSVRAVADVAELCRPVLTAKHRDPGVTGWGDAWHSPSVDLFAGKDGTLLLGCQSLVPIVIDPATGRVIEGAPTREPTEMMANIIRGQLYRSTGARWNALQQMRLQGTGTPDQWREAFGVSK